MNCLVLSITRKYITKKRVNETVKKRRRMTKKKKHDETLTVSADHRVASDVGLRSAAIRAIRRGASPHTAIPAVSY